MDRLFWAIFCILLAPSDNANILLIPMHHGAHIKLLANIGAVLKDRGHVVYEIVAEKYAHLATEQGIRVLMPNVSNQVSVSERLIMGGEIYNPLIAFPKAIGMVKQHTRETFADKDIMKKLEDLQFNLVIMDAFDLNLPSFMIPYKLSLPYISINSRSDPWTVRAPALPSVEGMHPFMIMTEDSNIFHRIANTLAYFGAQLLVLPSFLSPLHDDAFFTDLVPEKENIGLHQLYMESEMFLVNSNIYCFDETRVSAPHYQYVPAIGAGPAKTLSPEIAQIMDGSKEGVILLAFGSAFKEIPDERLAKMVSAFRKLKFDVILRHTGEHPKDMPNNLHIKTWLPQNDILGHPKTKLFITHMGLNGLLEAIYHGVPLLMMPHSTDQFFNSRKGEAKGYGKIVNPSDFTAEELKQVIMELTENPMYKDNIAKCSQVIRSLPRGQDTVAFWVEHVLHFGGSHLKPYYLHMPLWKFLMFDVVLVFLTVGFLTIFALKWCCMNFCCKRKRHQKME